MSKFVRLSSRCASSSRPAFLSSASRSHELLADQLHRALERRALRDEVLRRIDRRALERGDRLAGEHVDLRDALDLVAPELDAHPLLLVRRKDLDRVAAHAERAALERDVVAVVLDLHERAQDVVAVHALALRERHHLLAIRHRIAEAVDRAHRGDDDDVVALHERRGRAQPQPVDVLVDRRVLLDVRVGRRDVRFRLVVVVVRDEVLDRVVREEALDLPVELRRERLVVAHDERRLPVLAR